MLWSCANLFCDASTYGSFINIFFYFLFLQTEIRARIEQILLKSCPNFLSPSLPHNVSLRSIRRKAKEIAATLGVGSFVPSRRWILSFVHRHKLLNNATVANNKCVNIGTSDGVNGTSETLPKVYVNSVYELSDSDTSLEEVMFFSRSLIQIVFIFLIKISFK